MKILFQGGLGVLGVISLAVAPVASAHHSAAATYEADRSIEIAGRVLEYGWSNPHCHLSIDVTEGPFKGQTYVIELGSPVVLVDTGWTRTLFQPGDRVAMRVHPSRAGALVGLCRDCPVTINGKAPKFRRVHVWREREAVQ